MQPKMTIVARDLGRSGEASRGWYVCDESGRNYLDKNGAIGNGVHGRPCFWATEAEAQAAMLGKTPAVWLDANGRAFGRVSDEQIEQVLLDALTDVRKRSGLMQHVGSLTAPAGYALVPLEPTQEMIEAWNMSEADDFKILDPFNHNMSEEQWGEWKRLNATRDWSAMIAAAPKVME